MEFKINKVPTNSVRTAESQPQICLSIYSIANLEKLVKFQQAHVLSNTN